jgi:alkylhydroperoxidase/carboxymuconolactone decarboxylase family protein YurZ
MISDENPYGPTERARLKETVERRRGYWHAFHQGLLEYSPAYLQAYLDFHEPPFTANRLGEKLCEFIYIAVDAAVSHLFTAGVEMHIKKALGLGATAEEVMEVIQLAMLAAHSSHSVGMPILVEELDRAGLFKDEVSRPLTDSEQVEKARYIESVGQWPEGADVLFRIAPGFMKGFLSYGEIPYRAGPLPPLWKELICIAVFASPVAPQPGPLRSHIRRALEIGVNPHEISDAIQLSSGIAIHTCVAAVPALLNAIEAIPKAGDSHQAG